MLTINMAETGLRIQELRERAGLSVRDLQEAMDPISIQAIYKWQQGLAVPSVDNLIILAEILGEPLDGIIVRENVG